MSPQEYCHQKVKESGSNFSVAFSLLSPSKRIAIESLYAFCREVDDVVDECNDPNLAKIKLSWWKNELDQINSNPQHPILLSLRSTLKNFDLPIDDFNKIIEGVHLDIEHKPFETWNELDDYCDKVAGAVGRLAAGIFGPTNYQINQYATLLGQACQYTNILRDIGEDLSNNRVYIPNALLRKHKAEINFDEVQYSKNFISMCDEFSQHAHKKYADAFSLLPRKDYQNQRPGIVMGIIYKTLLIKIEKSRFEVLNKKISLSPLQKFWAAWKASWGEIPK